MDRKGHWPPHVLKLFLLLSLVIVSPRLVYSHPWPFKTTDESPLTNTQQKIRQAVGAFRGSSASPRFHRGVDIVPLDGFSWRIYATTGGVVEYWYSGGTDPYNEYVQIGGIKYFHVEVVEPFKIRNTQVLQGDFVGTVKESPNVDTHGVKHLHLQYSNTSNPLNHLEVYSDSTLPELRGMKIFKYNDNSETGEIPDTQEVFFGKYDFLVDGNDVLDDGTWVQDFWNNRIAPYRLGYQILDSSDLNHVTYDRFNYIRPEITFDQKPSIRFSAYPPNTNVNYIYDVNDGSNRNKYWVTNETFDGEEPKDRYWNSRRKLDNPYNIG